MTGIPLAGLIGAPISGLLLDMDGVASLRGWQWLFILEALPSILMGLYIFRYLPDKPQDARWLSSEEKGILIKSLASEVPQIKGDQKSPGPYRAFASFSVWYMGVIYFFQMTGLYGIGLWLPDLIRASTNLGNVQTGFLTAIPFLLGALSMVLWGWNSDRTKERKWHLLIANLVGSMGFVAAGFKPESLPVALLGITIASVGVHATFGPFWALKTSLLAPGVAAVGIALINSIGNLGGFLGPSITGFLKQQTGSLSWGLILYGSASFFAAVMALFLKPPSEVTRRQ